MESTQQRLFSFLNLIEILGIFTVLFLAGLFQLIYHELPCPLCLLQRVGFIGICIGLLMNLRFGPKPAHYSLTLLSALLTSWIALRQIALHVVPGTGSYGDPVFGFHLYTWSFILSTFTLLYTAIVLAFQQQYSMVRPVSKVITFFTQLCFVLLFAITLLNGISTVLECGFHYCPDNPTHYIF